MSSFSGKFAAPRLGGTHLAANERGRDWHSFGCQRHRMGGGLTLQGAPEYAHEYFSQEESVESSTFRELLGVIRCLKSMVLLCEGKFVVF